MTSISKMCILINQMIQLMNEMTPANVKSSIYIDFNAEKNDEDSQFKVGDLVRISKYKYIFAKSDTQN